MRTPLLQGRATRVAARVTTVFQPHQVRVRRTADDADAALVARIAAVVQPMMDRTEARLATPSRVPQQTPTIGPGRHPTASPGQAGYRPGGHQGSSRIQVDRLPEFTEAREREGARSYLEDCVGYLRAWNAHEEGWAQAIMARLTSAQKSSARSRSGGRDPTFDEMWAAMDLAYPTTTDQQAEQRLNALERTASQDVTAFARRIRELQRPTTRESDMQRVFMRGLDPTVGTALAATHNATFDELVAAARKIEIQREEWGIRPLVHTSPVQAAPMALDTAPRLPAADFCSLCGVTHTRGGCFVRKAEGLEREWKKMQQTIEDVKKAHKRQEHREEPAQTGQDRDRGRDQGSGRGRGRGGGRRVEQMRPQRREAGPDECHICGGTGHWKDECPQADAVRAGRCFGCGERGHRKQDCPKQSAGQASGANSGTLGQRGGWQGGQPRPPAPPAPAMRTTGQMYDEDMAAIRSMMRKKCADGDNE